MKPRAAFLMTHPTQYHSPWFRALAARPEISIHVYYCVQPGAEMQGKDFGVAFEWDMPLLDGYPSSFLKNVAATPGWGFRNIDTPELRELIPQRDFDAWVINGWTTKSEWLAIRTCWKSGIPMMVRGDSTLLDHRHLRTRIAKRLILGRWIPRFTRYLTVGVLNARYYEFYGADPRKFVPVRHFVDNNWFATRAHRARDKRDERRQAWAIRGDAFVFLFAGKLITKKQPLAAIEALARVYRSHRNVHLVIAGDGELRSACEQLAQRLKVPVTFTGFLNQSAMPDAYAIADVLVLPSTREETWGLVVNEAMASCLPAIVSDKVGCSPDLIVEGDTGYSFAAGNVDALAQRMIMFADSPQQAARQGRLAFELVSNYSLEEATENTVRAIVDTSAGIGN